MTRLRPTRADQMRARYPDEQGHVEREGVRVFWERYGEGEHTVVLLPPWPFGHSRIWKSQIPYLARDHRVVVFDPRGNGRSDRPRGTSAYSIGEFVADALAVMDAVDVERAVVVATSRATQYELALAADHPERVRAAVFIGGTLPLTPWPPYDVPLRTFEEASALRRRAAVLSSLPRSLLLMPTSRSLRDLVRRVSLFEGVDMFNRFSWERDYAGFLEWLTSTFFTPEPHSTKHIEDIVGWGLESDAETLAASWVAPQLSRAETSALVERLHCPALVLHGARDLTAPIAWGEALAQATSGRLVRVERSSHSVFARWPVETNLALRDFVAEVEPSTGSAPARDSTAHRPSGRRRALFVSSPIGLGHAQRDVAIARELRTLVPDLEIDWLAQDPVTRVLEAAGERIHPASRELASESAHFEAEAGEHEVHCFQALRRMDEIMVANFMVFHEVASRERYDLWIWDEAWELDHHLFENPWLKGAPLVWLTDVVGQLPMPSGGDYEAFLTADYNAEMVEHVADHPELRDRAIFIGSPEDIVPDRLGPGLPGVREWTEAHFDFAGYVLPFDPAELADTERLRRDLGHDPDRPLIVAAVGGSGVGGHLLRRIAAAFALLRRDVPDARLLLCCGPRIDPRTIEPVDGMEAVGYVPDLFRTLACCDLAVVQGGLTTTMELVANRRPFIYVPLRDHNEQCRHVVHRLRRYGAPEPTAWEDATPASLAAEMLARLRADVDYRPVERDGARRAAEMIASLVDERVPARPPEAAVAGRP